MGRRLQIRVVDIAKEFGRTGALRGVNLDIRDGELIALLGPSGSGKTTLLRVIAGLEAPSAGKVYFDGEDATAVPVQRRRIGFVFQNYSSTCRLRTISLTAYGSFRVVNGRSGQPSSNACKSCSTSWNSRTLAVASRGSCPVASSNA
jgi:ABC-type sulfate/molybdate transport systems ATPase subunit